MTGNPHWTWTASSTGSRPNTAMFGTVPDEAFSAGDP
jgi:hypothetical protein